MFNGLVLFMHEEVPKTHLSSKTWERTAGNVSFKTQGSIAQNVSNQAAKTGRNHKIHSMLNAEPKVYLMP